MSKFLYTICLFVLAACLGCSSGESSMSKADASPAISTAAKAVENLKDLKFDYPKDPACGSALSEGVGDSTEYKGKLYGFCSKECKEKFVKSPESFLAHLAIP